MGNCTIERWMVLMSTSQRDFRPDPVNTAVMVRTAFAMLGMIGLFTLAMRWVGA